MPPAEPVAPEPAPVPAEHLNTSSRHAGELVAEIREVSRLRREADTSLVFESQLRATPTKLHADLEYGGLEMGAAL